MTYSQSHEFPLVLLLLATAGWVRATLAGVPGFRWLAGRRSRSEPWTLSDLSVPDRCRAVAVLSMADVVDDDALDALRSPEVHRRARRVGVAARWRFAGDPLRNDHAHTRAAMLMCGLLDATGTERLTADAHCSRVGVPCSEPTWVRPLDATLVAVALEDAQDATAAQRWRLALAGPFAIRRGHRAAWWWSPLGLSAGKCCDWEHALVTAIAHSRGWIDEQDWPALRQRVLGAAARGSERSDDERLVAAGRVWLNFIDDPAAAAVLYRPTVKHDPLAVAIDRLAEHFRAGRAAHVIEESGDA
ncbi:hypothetical protein [Mycolicibacterium pyrenivorans]|uniref:hypothetical protein n=1 Tax=Mycolicibacterium pyrenivorans TaxID=187102 RepID=UPI0021F2B42E|nr:hypothetical protein [Mycolicibacterium pyrenivorans]MCV7149987.1 hypothetical protein [Mycolicibacterium pyrenivorans]